MGNGDYTDAKIALQDIVESIKILENTDPDNVKIDTFKTKVNGIVRGIKSNTGEIIDPWAETVSNETKTHISTTVKTSINPPPTAASKDVSAQKLPYGARQVMEEVKTQFRKIDSNYSFLKTADVHSDHTVALVDQIPSLVEELQPLLDKAKEISAKDGVVSHPDFETAQIRINEQFQKYQETRKTLLTRRQQQRSILIEIKADINSLKTEYDRLERAYFRHAKGSAIYANDLPPLVALINLIEKFERDEKSKVTALVNNFALKYRDRKKEITQVDRQVNYYYNQLIDGVENVTKTRKSEYDEMVKRVALDANYFSSMGDFARIESHNTARKWMELATRFAPSKVIAKQQSDALENFILKDKQLFFKKIASVTWAGSTHDKNSKAALKYFQESANWRKNPNGAETPLGVIVVNSWSVQKRNIVGNPTAYGIAAQIAVQKEEDKDGGLARVFNVTLIAQESTNPVQSPPFVSYSVGDSWYILADKIM